MCSIDQMPESQQGPDEVPPAIPYTPLYPLPPRRESPMPALLTGLVQCCMPSMPRHMHPSWFSTRLGREQDGVARHVPGYTSTDRRVQTRDGSASNKRKKEKNRSTEPCIVAYVSRLSAFWNAASRLRSSRGVVWCGGRAQTFFQACPPASRIDDMTVGGVCPQHSFFSKWQGMQTNLTRRKDIGLTYPQA
ncbi:hypothetical protein LZ31DRAFT_337890 [Colletotrichum somersetense]|nr:hypothetical protein LZ31DRAFT_337890 [Colletotrichum somersetense]